MKNLNPEIQDRIDKLRAFVAENIPHVKAMNKAVETLNRYDGNDADLVRAINVVTRDHEKRRAEFEMSEMLVKLMSESPLNDFKAKMSFHDA